MVLFAENLGEMEKILQAVNIICDKCCIVSLANSRNSEVSKRNSKIGFLSCMKLLFTENFVMIRRINSSLLKAAFISNWAHQVTLPVNKSISVLKPIVQIKE